MPTALVIGDVMTDIVVRPQGAIARGADTRATIRSVPGGSGANQAAWLATEGVTTIFAGRVGRRDHAHHIAALHQYGVRAELGVDDDVATGTLVTLVTPDGERSFLTERGANDRLCDADLPDALLDGIDLMAISGYALLCETPRAAVLRLAAEARRRDITIAVDPGSYSYLAEIGPANVLAWTEMAQICIANRNEAAVLTGVGDLGQQLQRLNQTYALAVVKCGAEGAVAASGAKRCHTAAPAVEVVDPTGAGDAFAGGFLAAFLSGADVGACLRRGAALGAQCVAQLGGRPPVPADRASRI